MPVMLDMILKMEFVLHLLSPVQVDNTDTMESAIPLALLEAVLKVTSVREFAQLDHGHTIVDAIELALLNTRPMMPALIHALLEQLFKMEFAKLVLRAALQDNITMQLLLHALPVNILALSVL
jgi:hypothetical protein